MVTAEDAIPVVPSVPELAGDEQANTLFDALPIPELATMWCALQRVSRRDQAGSVWAATGGLNACFCGAGTLTASCALASTSVQVAS